MIDGLIRQIKDLGSAMKYKKYLTNPPTEKSDVELIAKLAANGRYCWDRVEFLNAEITRLREALSFYAYDGWKDRPLDPPTSQEIETFEGLILDFPTPEVLFDRGDRARAALKGETP